MNNIQVEQSKMYLIKAKAQLIANLSEEIDNHDLQSMARELVDLLDSEHERITEIKRIIEIVGSKI